MGVLLGWGSGRGSVCIPPPAFLFSIREVEGTLIHEKQGIFHPGNRKCNVMCAGSVRGAGIFTPKGGGGGWGRSAGREKGERWGGELRTRGERFSKTLHRQTTGKRKHGGMEGCESAEEIGGKKGGVAIYPSLEKIRMRENEGDHEAKSEF